MGFIKDFPMLQELFNVIAKYDLIDKKEAGLLAGFVTVYCYALPDVRFLLTKIIESGLKEAKDLNKNVMKELENKLLELESSKAKKKVMN